MNFKFAFTILLFSALLISCSSENNKNQIVVGIPSDVETLNPLYAFSVEEGNIAELLYLSLVNEKWDSEKSDIKYNPMLAEKWKWNKDENSVIIEIRDDVYWSDGIKCSIEDVIFSFALYSDQKVQSRTYGYFENFHTSESGLIDSSKTFEILNENSIKIKFKKKSNPDFTDIKHPILPKHFWNKFNREDIPTLNISSYVTNGPFTVERWEKEEAVILAKNPNSFLVQDETINKIIFKIIPEYQNRLSQLITGNIDLMEDIKTDDIAKLKQISNLNVVPVSGRDFDYIGWNNISPKEYANSKIVPHELFGSSKVRRALTLALNREIVVDEYLKGYGSLASTPVSHIFTNIFDSTITALSFNADSAKSILKSEGWSDTNGDGTIDKDGTEFVFTLHIPAGNPRREFAASLFQNNLKALGIDMVVELNELGFFIENLFSKQFDSWMAAWVIPIPINLKISWYSNLDQTPLNFASFQNKEIDLLLDKLENSTKDESRNIYKNIQEILYNNQPYSFLYWIDNMACYNNRIGNISIDPLGTIKNCWEWKLN